MSQRLAQTGVRLEQSYVTPKCSPSRAALMTGLYPWRLGMQRGAIERFQPDGLNSSLTLLPEHLQQAGYQTHLVSLKYWNKTWNIERQCIGIEQDLSTIQSTFVYHWLKLVNGWVGASNCRDSSD